MRDKNKTHPHLARIGVSMDAAVLEDFDREIRKRRYPTRSKAIEDLAREAVSRGAISSDASKVIGAIHAVYDHHKRELLNRLTDIQHDFQDIILSSQHIHLDHDNCFEIIIVKGTKNKVTRLADLIKSAKGVKYAALSCTAAP